MSYRLFTLVVFFSLLVSSDSYAAQPKEKIKALKNTESNTCTASILMDADSGVVLSETNADEALAPASMVKLMTTYSVFKLIKDGQLKMSDLISVSSHASKIGGSQVYLKDGEQFTLQEMLEALLVQSANDAAVAIAEHVSGSSEGFVEIMNQDAREIGMKNFEFFSPHGLPPSIGQQADIVSARDFAVLSRALIKEFPEVLKFTSISESTFRNGSFVLRNHNHLVRDFNGCDGLKTGFYNRAGFSVSATAVRKGVRMIAVVMGCNNRKKRDAETAKLMSMGFAQFRSMKILDKGTVLEPKVPIQNGTKKDVNLVAANDVFVSIRQGEEKKIVRKPEFCSGFTAPVMANTPCGNMVLMLNDKEIAKVAAIIDKEVPQGNIGDKIWNMIVK